ncbi:MAG TPA: Dam family site-specific DNA-(adenine-N6)-methyltransferase [Pyrinomonadaceae bacterium]|nr:Dam family site-specific DNA-(adenine-N6)-methyltransferase [Pyrinomonadaceae bacterium]
MFEESEGVQSDLKPPLKWAGGKRWLASYVSHFWKPHHNRRYVEPFCGGLAVALSLQPRLAILNDINPHLINFYRQVQKGLELYIEMKNDEEVFYKQRQRFNELARQSEASSEAAQLFYYLNRTCFNGLCRFNQSGEFNVPFGAYKSITYASDFLAYRQLFRNWTFSNCDIQSFDFAAGDFIYADPPYDVEFTTYSAGGFSWDDQVRTAELLSNHRGPVLISNQATKRIVGLYKRLKFKLEYLDAPRRISCTGDRSTAREVLATKNL